MDERVPAVEVDGDRIRTGTSVYHTVGNRVLWVDDIVGDVVVLGTVERTVRVSKEVFRKNVEDGTLKIESKPPGGG